MSPRLQIIIVIIYQFRTVIKFAV